MTRDRIRMAAELAILVIGLLVIAYLASGGK